MSIASAITAAQGKVADAYTAVNTMGGTLPATQNLTNLPSAIQTISTGITPTGTINITANGTYGVDTYAYANVNVSSGASIDLPREIDVNGVYQIPTTVSTFSLPNNATSLGVNALSHAFYGCTSLTSVDLSSLTSITNDNAAWFAFGFCTNLTSADLSNVVTIGKTLMSQYYIFYRAFYGCTNLANIDLSSLTTINAFGLDDTFYGCTSLTSVDLSSVTYIGYRGLHDTFYGCTSLTSVDLSGVTEVKSLGTELAFSGCTNLTSVDFSGLIQIGSNTSGGSHGEFANCFRDCTALTSITFPNLEKIYCTDDSASYGTFANNNKVQKMYFPKLDTITYGTGASSKNQAAAKNIFYNCSSLTELHFGAANQSAIEASPGYSTAWGRGAGNVTIYFDL